MRRPGCIEANAHEEGTAHFLDGRNGIVLFRFDIKAGTDQGVARRPVSCGCL